MRRWLRSCAAAALIPAFAWAAETRTVVLDMSGMTCSLCPLTVREALERVPGVLEARVDFSQRRATAKYDPDKASPEALAKAVIEAGFPAKERRP